MGRPELGPLDDSRTPPLLRRDVAELQTNLAVGDGTFTVMPPSEQLWGLLAPFNTRARHIIVSLLRGYSHGMAATAAGVAENTMQRWMKAHPEFREAVGTASQMGFRRTFEPELYRRAMAGREDRGSMRALELVTKARDSAYRDKSQVQHEIITRAQESTAALTGGWQAQPEPD